MIQATTRKAEMQCRAEALKTKMALEREEYELREQIDRHEREMRARLKELEQHKEWLAMQTEIRVEDAKLTALGRLDVDGTEKGSDEVDEIVGKEKAKGDSVREWLRNSELREPQATKQDSGVQLMVQEPLITSTEVVSQPRTLDYPTTCTNQSHVNQRVTQHQLESGLECLAELAEIRIGQQKVEQASHDRRDKGVTPQNDARHNNHNLTQEEPPPRNQESMPPQQLLNQHQQNVEQIRHSQSDVNGMGIRMPMNIEQQQQNVEQFRHSQSDVNGMGIRMPMNIEQQQQNVEQFRHSQSDVNGTGIRLPMNIEQQQQQMSVEQWTKQQQQMSVERLTRQQQGVEQQTSQQQQQMSVDQWTKQQQQMSVEQLTKQQQSVEQQTRQQQQQQMSVEQWTKQQLQGDDQQTRQQHQQSVESQTRHQQQRESVEQQTRQQPNVVQYQQQKSDQQVRYSQPNVDELGITQPLNIIQQQQQQQWVEQQSRQQLNIDRQHQQQTMSLQHMVEEHSYGPPEQFGEKQWQQQQQRGLQQQNVEQVLHGHQSVDGHEMRRLPQSTEEQQWNVEQQQWQNKPKQGRIQQRDVNQQHELPNATQSKTMFPQYSFAGHYGPPTGPVEHHQCNFEQCNHQQQQQQRIQDQDYGQQRQQCSQLDTLLPQHIVDGQVVYQYRPLPPNIEQQQWNCDQQPVTMGRLGSPQAEIHRSASFNSPRQYPVTASHSPIMQPQYRLGHVPMSQYSQADQNRLPSSTMLPPVTQWTSQQSTPSPQMTELVLQQNNLTAMLLEQQVKASLPARSIKPYDGNPLEFHRFMRAFKHGVIDKTQNDIDRMSYLEQYTIGEANRLIQGLLRKSDGFPHAMALLEKRFGNKYVIADAFHQQASKWSDVKGNDAKAWNNLSSFLIGYFHTMEDLGVLGEVDHSASIKALLHKLPYGFRSQWRSKVTTIEEESGRMAGFKDFVEFVQRITRMVSNPLYGDVGGDKPQSKNNQKNEPKFRRRAFATNVEGGSVKTQQESKSKQKHCFYCGEGSRHATLECRKLEQLPANQKSAFCFKNRLCFGCLGAGHTKSECKKKELSKCGKCEGAHPTVLHKTESNSSKSSSQTQQPPEKKTSCTGMLGAGNGNSNPHMAIIPVKVKAAYSQEYITTYAFLDDGCSAVFADSEICDALKVKTRRRSLILKTLTSEEAVESAVVEDRLQVAGIEGGEFIDLPEVYVKNNIPVSPQDMVRNDNLKEWPHLSHISLPELEGHAIPKVTLMVGMNIPAATMPLEVITGDVGAPYGVRTPLGWVIYGVPGRPRDYVGVNYVNVQDGLRNLEEQFNQYVNMDFTERAGEDIRSPSREDQRFLDFIEKTTEYHEGHYQTGLPLKNPEVKLPDVHQQVLQRTEQLKRKFKKDPDFHEKYTLAMNDTLDKGYAEPVPEDQKNRNDGKIWYIPHFGVSQPQKQKIRIVYDCAAEYGGKALNKELLQGPDLTNGLIGVLMRFRQEQVAIKSDIEAMFYQVQVRPDDRDLLRFYWWPGGDLNQDLKEYRMAVHVFGAVSSPSIANYALQKTAIDNRASYSKEATDAVAHNFYVDDFCKSCSSEHEAQVLAQDMKDLLAEGGFRLTKWTSSSRQVLNSIPQEERSKEVKNLRIDQDILPPDRTLGVLWCVESDTFSFEIRVKDREPTRRGILSIVSSVFDPLGIVSAAIMPAKLLLQDLCRMKLKWDQQIPEEFLPRWNRWLTDLPKLEQIAVDRCFKPKGFTDPVCVQIHHFADASEKGYGVITYLRLVNDQGDVHCTFVSSKSRVAPLKQQSIPRLELTAATVAVRVHNMIIRELEIPIDDVFFWTDSQTVIKYICNETIRFRTFVANRLAVIRESSKPSQWKYVATHQNPADDCSRGLTIDKLLTSDRWFRGPEFLWHPQEEWQADSVTDKYEDDLEFERAVMVNVVKTEEPNLHPVGRLLQHYSSWTALKRAVAWWMRLKMVLQCKARAQAAMKLQHLLSVEELERAEMEIIKWDQNRSFPHVKKLVDENRCSKSIEKNVESSLASLDPIMQNGVLKVGGRLGRAHISEEAKHQVILPQDSLVSNLIIKHVHEKINHQGQNHVLGELRRKYWIVRARVLVKKILRRCVICKKVQARQSQQKMADLPDSRLQFEKPPFTSTGVDYFGPFNIKQGRSTRKRYGVIFTCLTSRAVHIEVAETLDTSSCISALRRFIARRGQIKELISDNGSNLVGANTELKQAIKEWNQEEITNFTANRNIQWKFNPPSASHFGGSWERQIRTIRKILQAMLNEQYIRECRDDEQLRTLMCEVESTINSRPLTHASDDPRDLNTLTPNDLLLLQPSNMSPPPPGKFTEKDLYSRKRWRQMQYLSDLFWKRWSKEYLVELQKRQKWLHPKRNIQVGDVVLVVDNQAPRNSWPLGLVEETYPDNNGLVRSVKVKTKSTVLVRPVVKLCLLLEQEATVRNQETDNRLENME